MSTDYNINAYVTVQDFIRKLPSGIRYDADSHRGGDCHGFPTESFRISAADNSWLRIYAEKNYVHSIVRHSSVNDGGDMIQSLCDALGVEIISDEGEVFRPRKPDSESPPAGSETPG